MAVTNKDILASGDDEVELSQGGGPFQDYDDVPGKTSKQQGSVAPARRKKTTDIDDLAGR